MRSLLFATVLAMAVIGALRLSVSEDAAYAKGTAIVFTPESGSAYEEMIVWSKDWPENTEVRLFASFALVMEGSYPPADEFVGPFEVVRSDMEGRWEALITPDTIVGLGLPGEPGYLIIRAESDDLALYLEGANSNHFVLTVDGQRPAGSGKIEVSIKFESEQPRVRYGGFGWRRVGNDSFYSPYQAGLSMPGTRTTSSLSDGDYEVALSLPDDLEISTGDHFRLDSGPMCDGLEGVPCFQANRLFVLNISVVNAEIAHADIVLRRIATVQPVDLAIDTLVATVPPSEDGRTALIAGASVLLAILAAGTVVLGRRRARR